MGIVNVTPDSFSDGGRFVEAGAAVAHALDLLAEGADIIDIGGESTRPGAEPVEAGEEARRVVPVVAALRLQAPQALISVDTMKASVARAALEAGADILNDVTGLVGDAAMAEVAAASSCGLVVMHMQGQPRTMQDAPRYKDVVGEVRRFFLRRLEDLAALGISATRVAFDPGIGFGKTTDHNLQILGALGTLAPDGRPLMVGVSRKSFLGRVLGSQSLTDRAWPTVALSCLAAEMGARIVRVHDVRPNVEALRMTEAIRGGLWEGPRGEGE